MRLNQERSRAGNVSTDEIHLPELRRRTQRSGNIGNAGFGLGRRAGNKCLSRSLQRTIVHRSGHLGSAALDSIFPDPAVPYSDCLTGPKRGLAIFGHDHPRRSPSVFRRMLLGPRLLGNIVPGVFTLVLAKHSKSLSLIDCISVGVDRMQRNFEPMRKQEEAWPK